MRVLITGGATRNGIDAIRYMSAHATGNTAVDLTRLLVAPQRRERLTRSNLVTVDFLGSAEACLRLRVAELEAGEDFAVAEEFFSTRDLLARMQRLVPYADVVIHSAAVGDYEWDTTAAKIPSGQPEVTVKGRPAPKILDLVRGWNPECVLVSFKACSPETSQADLERIALAQLQRTRSDFVVGNVIGHQGVVSFFDKDGFVGAGPRDKMLPVLVDIVRDAVARRTSGE